MARTPRPWPADAVPSTIYGMIAVAAMAASAGLIHAAGSLCGRRAALAAVPVPTMALALAAGLALAAAPWWCLGGARLLPDPWWLAPAAGLLLAAGNLAAMAAISRGSAAVAVPVLSGKVVLVAIGAAALGGTVGAATWAGAALVCAGIALLAAGPRGGRPGAAIALALLAALGYAGFDLLSAAHGRRLGIAGLLPAATAWALLASLPCLARARWPAAGRGALAWCAGLNGAQTALLTWAIILAGDAVLPNILYGCRGIWSVALLAAAGTWFGLAGDRAHLRRRLAGAALIAAAIACTLLGR